MKTLKAWLPFVGVSLVYHAILVLLVMQQLTLPRVEEALPQAITVQLSGKLPTTQTKPKVLDNRRIVSFKPIAETVRNEDLVVKGKLSDDVQETTSNTQMQLENNSEPSNAEKSNFEVVEGSKLTKLPKRLQDLPEYPNLERRNISAVKGGLSTLLIDKNGNVLDVTIVKSLGPGIDEFYKTEIRKIKFSPAYMGQEAVVTRLPVPFSVRLK